MSVDVNILYVPKKIAARCSMSEDLFFTTMAFRPSKNRLSRIKNLSRFALAALYSICETLLSNFFDYVCNNADDVEIVIRSDLSRCVFSVVGDKI